MLVVIVLHLHRVSRNCKNRLVSYLPVGPVIRPSNFVSFVKTILHVVWNNKANSTGRFADPIWRDQDNAPGFCSDAHGVVSARAIEGTLPQGDGIKMHLRL